MTLRDIIVPILEEDLQLGDYESVMSGSFDGGRISYALLPEKTHNRVLEEHHMVQGVPKVYKDWELWTDPPPDVETVTFYNQKLGYHSYNPPEGYTAKEIMWFRQAKKHLKTVEVAQKLIDSMELEGTLGWNLEDFYLQFRDGRGLHDIKRKSTEPVE
ncbi:hypothetical protein C8J56DRAFT_885721 [Mycena floridula]|nr:hypothetical protein C8J56DRAFT_885721 [Mycena floridula]